VRWAVQAVWLAALNPWGLYRVGGVCLPVLNCHGCPIAATTCPIGAFGNMLDLRVVPFLVLGSWGLVGALVGRLPCAWACPFGLLQDLFAKLRFIPRWRPPRWTSALKYAVLVGMVLVAGLTVGSASRWYFCGICPAGTGTAGIPTWIRYGLAVPSIRLVFLGIFLAMMLFVTRGFCRLACPIGAGLALFNRFSLWRLRVNQGKCVACGLCRKVCPMGEDPAAAANGEECIRCLDCRRCPERAIGLGMSNVPAKDAGGG